MSATPQRPKLTSLADRFAQKGTPAPTTPPESAPQLPGAQPEPEGEGGSKDMRVQVLVRMTPQERKALRRIALDLNSTVQALCEDTLRDLIRRYGG